MPDGIDIPVLNDNVVKGLMRKKRMDTIQSNLDTSEDAINTEVGNRNQRYQDTAAAMNAPVKPQKWYQRLAQGAFLGLASRMPEIGRAHV